MGQCEFMLETPVSAAISKLFSYKIKQSWLVLKQDSFSKVSVLGSIIVAYDKIRRAVRCLIFFFSCRLHETKPQEIREKLEITSEG